MAVAGSEGRVAGGSSGWQAARSALVRQAKAAALALIVALGMVAEVHAQFATGGTGLHRARIFWVDWGTVGDNVYGGSTITRGFNVDSPPSAANRLDITCTLSNAATTNG
nr:hypothetical protein [Burkholderiaceae bacterium]